VRKRAEKKKVYSLVIRQNMAGQTKAINRK
jgi:hypothetical protein